MKDKQVEKIIKEEQKRENSFVELIASENFVSHDVLDAAGSIMTNKYAEGYPNARYYHGCESVDKVETLAIERLKKLFNVKFANVQPHSGSQANAAAFFALLKPGDKVLGMSLASGGHLTHGYKITFSGTYFDSYTYDVDKKTNKLNYDEIAKIAKKVKPKLIICGYSAYPRKINFKKFREIADSVGAYLMADIAHIAGLIAAKQHPSPIKYCDIITSTTHKTLRGPRGGIIMTNNPDIAKKIDKAVFPGTQGGPLMHIIAAKAVAFGEALKPSFVEYQKKVISNCKIMEKSFKQNNIKIISGGTDNHLLLLNVKDRFNISGAEAADILFKANIVCNKNAIPFDPLPPKVSSGIRIGSAAMTTKGWGEKEFTSLVNIIVSLLDDHSTKNINKQKKLIKNLLND